jgi:hypothetical protein
MALTDTYFILLPGFLLHNGKDRWMMMELPHTIVLYLVNEV